MSEERTDAGTASTVAKGIKALHELARRATESAYLVFLAIAYPTQVAFLNSFARIAVLFGGNQSGKSFTLLHLDVWDLTGNYPVGYKGFRFNKPIDMWIVGETNELTRDSLQKALFGPDPSKPGVGGLIPPGLIDGKPTVRHNISGAFDTVRIKNLSGGISTVQFKSYAQGRESLQAWTGDVVHVDEEPPFDCWTELLMRLVARKGRMRMSFTPLKMWTKTVDSLMRETDDEGKVSEVARFFLSAEEATHLGMEHVKRIKALNLPPEEMLARLYGMPGKRIGRIWNFKRADITISRFDIPPDWPTLGCLDPGFDHPTALLQAHRDPLTKTLFITRSYRKGGLQYHHHAREMKAWPCKWIHDPAANQGSKRDGVSLTTLYLNELQPDWEYVPPEQRIMRLAKNEVEVGLDLVQSYLNEGKLLVFDDLIDLLQEMDDYERKPNGSVKKEVKESNGVVRKVADDLVDDLRYLVMADALTPDYYEVFNGEKPWWLAYKKPQATTCQPGY